MSRAFTKEIDDAPAPPPLPRAISSAPNLITSRGAKIIQDKLEELDSRLMVEQPSEQDHPLRIERAYWASRLATMQVMAPRADPHEVAFGSVVEIRRDGKTMRFRIVGEDEADPRLGSIAWTSPLAAALQGARRDDLVEFQNGPRSETIEVLSVQAE